jgi:hypothetical protein
MFLNNAGGDEKQMWQKWPCSKDKWLASSGAQASGVEEET